MIKMSNNLKLFLGSLIFLGYFSILIYTPIHMIEMADMNMPMEHCPFAMNQHVICSMTISEHIREWQNWLQSFLPSFKILTSATLFFALSYLLVTSPPILRLLLYCKRQGKVKTYSFLQNLFSQGILHTKAY
jgi:hypothetical protein